MKRIYRKRLISFAVALSMLLSCVAGGAVAKAAAQVWGNGGEDLNWTDGDSSITMTLENGVMTVTGNGAMGNYSLASKLAYKDVADTITRVVVSSGITAVGKMNFNKFENCTSIELAETVKTIGEKAFSGCTNTELVIDIKGTEVAVGSLCFGQYTGTGVEGTIKVYDQTTYENVQAEVSSQYLNAKIQLAGSTDGLKTDLKQLVDDTRQNYPEANYTEDSYAALKEALTKADGVLANSGAEAAEFTQAKSDIEKAIDRLVTKVDGAKKELNTVISNAEKMSTGGYTKSSVAALEAAIAAAKEAYKNATTVDQVQQAKTTLEEAMAVDETGLADKGLKRNADSENRNKLNAAANSAKRSELYTKESYAEYQAVLDKIKEMQTNGCSNEQVEAVLAELAAAEEKLVRDENYAPDYDEYEKAKAAVLKILNEEDSPYTKNSLNTLTTIYNYQTSMIETDGKYRDDRVQSQVDSVTETLKNAIDPASDSYRLVEKGDTTELAALVASAKELDESKYTVASWLDLSDALAVAEPLVADPDNAAKADVEAAVKAMKNAMAGLVEKSQNPGDTTTPGGDGDGSTTNPGGNGDGSTTTPGGNGDGGTTNPGGNGDGSTTNPGGNGDGGTTNPGGNGNGGTTQPTQKPNSTQKVTVKKVSVKKASSPKKKTLKVTWKKVGDAAGYQIQISTDKKFKKGVKKYTVKKAKTTNKTIKKLKSKKTYYVKIRAYKTVSGKKYYGDWSKAKKAKVK